MKVFSEYQKIPLTEIKCLRIVYADLEHQTINLVTFVPFCLRRIWGLMDSINNRLQSGGHKWPNEFAPNHRTALCQITKWKKAKRPNIIKLNDQAK